MKQVRIGLIGTGYIGRAHAIAFAQAPTVFPLKGELVREMVAEITPTLAQPPHPLILQQTLSCPF